MSDVSCLMSWLMRYPGAPLLPLVAVRPSMCVQEIRLGPMGGACDRRLSPKASWGSLPAQAFVVTLLSIHDPIKAVHGDAKARVWGLPWERVFQ